MIEFIKGDITKVKVDAIVNAANTTLLGGGGVDGATHRAAGPGLLEECKRLGGCPTGQAKITAGYNLPARYVIHTVGPVWHGGRSGEEGLLESCYRNSLELAAKNGLRTIAFPSISTGAYRFPIEKAAEIAIKTVKTFLRQNPGVFEKIIFVLFSDYDLEVYKKNGGGRTGTTSTLAREKKGDLM
ncbi:MAG: O-acetyl-ADP-ribose deacetylase [Candidatus Omnitrophica bacterium]|nr:O-acetyl-ADP-ribose deacetylase [Candidatus Omnitrophota bacterium]